MKTKENVALDILPFPRVGCRSTFGYICVTLAAKQREQPEQSHTNLLRFAIRQLFGKFLFVYRYKFVSSLFGKHRMRSLREYGKFASLTRIAAYASLPCIPNI